MAAARSESEGEVGREPAGASRGAFVSLLDRMAIRLGTREARLLLFIFLLALVLRLVFIAFVDPNPREGYPDDSLFYDHTAYWLAKGEGYIHLHGFPTAQWPPGYSLVLGGVYKAFGHHVILGKLLNALFGAATCVVVYAIGARVFDRRVALVAALILALFPSQVFGATLIMSEVFWSFVMMLFLLGVLRFTLGPGPPWRFAVVGLVLGLVSLIRGETVLFALALVPVWAVAHRSLCRGALYGAVALGATVVAVVPWTVRNWVELGYPIAISGGSAENLIAGHWEGADGLGSFIPVLAVQQKYEQLSPPDKEVEVYKEQTRRAIDYAAHHPLDELSLIPKKLYHFYRDDSRPLTWIQAKAPGLSRSAEARLRDLANTYYLAALVAAALGAPLWLARRDPRKLLLVMLVVYYSFLFGFVFVGEPRFHSVLIPVLSLFAAAFFVEAAERIGRRLRAAPAERGQRGQSGQ